MNSDLDNQFPHSYPNIELLGRNAIIQGAGEELVSSLRAMSVMACWHKPSTEEVIVTTAGGGCYVSREEKHQDGGGFFFVCLFLLSLHSSAGTLLL